MTDLPRSVDFYGRHFGLRLQAGTERPTSPPEQQMAVLLVDPGSKQRLELNFYPKGNPYAVPYVPGEGWDHLAFRVDDLDQTLARLAKEGVTPEKMAHYEGLVFATPSFRVAYIRDPDGNQIELYDSPGASAAYEPDQY